jgi:integrase
LRAVDFDLQATWQGEAMPWIVLPETKGNRWTSAARIVLLPECLLPILHELLPDDRQAPAFSFRDQGRSVPADKGEIRQRLTQLNVPFPRWHAGRHLLRTYLLEEGLPFDATNAILGHQSAGRELFNPYLPGNPGEAWRAFRLLADRLAQELGWPM